MLCFISIGFQEPTILRIINLFEVESNGIRGKRRGLQFFRESLWWGVTQRLWPRRTWQALREVKEEGGERQRARGYLRFRYLENRKSYRYGAKRRFKRGRVYCLLFNREHFYDRVSSLLYTCKKVEFRATRICYIFIRELGALFWFCFVRSIARHSRTKARLYNVVYSYFHLLNFILSYFIFLHLDQNYFWKFW